MKFIPYEITQRILPYDPMQTTTINQAVGTTVSITINMRVKKSANQITQDHQTTNSSRCTELNGMFACFQI